jgi:AcrR family transcriptional regulator
MLTSVNRKRGDDLLPAAMAVLRRDGPDALTMRNIAAEAKVTPTAFYRHFADKDALVRAVVREAFGVFRQAMVTELQGRHPEVWLRLAFERFLEFGLEHPNYYRLLFIEPHGFGIDRYPDDFRKGKSPAFRQLTSIVAECMRGGVLGGDPETDAPDVALVIYAHMHGLIALRLAGRFPDRREFKRFFLMSLDRLLAGLTAHPR